MYRNSNCNKTKYFVATHKKKAVTEKQSFSNEDVLSKKILKTFKYPHYTAILLWH